jgi:hypothetical protein
LRLDAKGAAQSMSILMIFGRRQLGGLILSVPAPFETFPIVRP